MTWAARFVGFFSPPNANAIESTSTKRTDGDRADNRGALDHGTAVVVQVRKSVDLFMEYLVVAQLAALHRPLHIQSRSTRTGLLLAAAAIDSSPECAAAILHRHFDGMRLGDP